MFGPEISNLDYQWGEENKAPLWLISGTCLSALTVDPKLEPTEKRWRLLQRGSVEKVQSYCLTPRPQQRQCPWQVLQHICLKYGRLQNLNLSTRGQYATVLTSLHSAETKKENHSFTNVLDNLILAIYLLISGYIIFFQTTKSHRKTNFVVC